MGRAWLLISWSRPLPFGYWTTETFVIFFAATVSCTCTGPQRVSATAPVTVVVALLGAAVVGAAAALDAAALLGDAALEDAALELTPPEMALPEAGAASEDRPPWAEADDVDVW
jgi:hypothetical protein